MADLRAGKVRRLGEGMGGGTTAAGVGPQAALARVGLPKRTVHERMEWLEKARVGAILGGMRLSLPSVQSGLRCYVAFVGELSHVFVMACRHKRTCEVRVILAPPSSSHPH